MRIKTIEKIRIIPPIESYNLHPYESNFDITVREINAKRKNMPMKLLKEFNTVVVLFFGGSVSNFIIFQFTPTLNTTVLTYVLRKQIS
tara:strand:- start:344 stop:607 length:264 start_codon:yes stop_codon:yes gene_type:complete